MNLNLSGGSWFALDIGTSAVRVVELKNPSSDQSQLLHHASIGIDKATGYSPANPSISSDQMIELIAKAVSTAGITNKNVVVGLPSSKAFATVVDMPKLGKKADSDKVIPVKAEEYIPMSIDQVDLDWQILGDSPTAQGDQEVLIVAVDKNVNKGHINLAKKAGLNVVATEPDAFAMTRSVIPKDQRNGSNIIIDIGNSETDMVVTYDGLPRLVRTLTVSMQQMTLQVSKILKESVAEAQSSIYAQGINPNGNKAMNNVLTTTAQTIITEAQKSMKFISDRYGSATFSSVYITGPGAYVPGLAPLMQQQLQLPVVLANSWANVKAPESVTGDKSLESNAFAVAVGLARRKA